MLKLYRSICQCLCPGGMTVSALAWKRARAGKPWLCNRIDGLWLLLLGQHQHCHSQFKRESDDETLDID